MFTVFNDNSYDDNYPNHDLLPTESATHEDDVPFPIGFPMNSDDEMIVEYNYDSSSDEDFTMTIQALDPPSRFEL